jgi:hypothetical protein
MIGGTSSGLSHRHVSAYMSKNQHVGFVGGFEVPDIVRQAEGYKDGARAVNPDIKVGVIYMAVGWIRLKVRKQQFSLLDLGADVIGQAADRLVWVQFLACQSRNAYAIGYVADQNHVAPKHVITSVMLVKKTAYLNMIRISWMANLPVKPIYLTICKAASISRLIMIWCLKIFSKRLSRPNKIFSAEKLW